MRHFCRRPGRPAVSLQRKGGDAVIFGKYINRYYLKNAPVLLLGLLAL